MIKADVAIIGGGIVGLATAYQVTQQFPDMRVVVLEKEAAVAEHQSGHNSGVLHSGVYYKPGSLKSINCREGKQAMVAFCQENDIPHEICGKVIVAVDPEEVPRLERILERGRQNGVVCELIDQQQLRQLEPHAAGVQAIHVPEAGIVNYRVVCNRLSEIVQARGGEVRTNAEVREVRRQTDSVLLRTNKVDVESGWLVNCAGLQCDRVARLCGVQPKAKIVPFRGEYYELKPEAESLCRNLIYPVPDPSFPFLGVHFTRMIEGGVECGPNAVLAFAREGYRKRDVSLADLCESLTYGGFLKLAARHWRMGAGEMWRSYRKAAFVSALQRLVPEIRSQQLVAARAGVRAQAVGPDGSLVDDFLIQRVERMIHVGNAPSPAATAALRIGKTIVEQLTVSMGECGTPT